MIQTSIELPWVCHSYAFVLALPDLFNVQALHPCYKYEYFDQKGWEEDWKDQAHTLIEDTFEIYKAAFDEIQDEPNDGEAPLITKVR